MTTREKIIVGLMCLTILYGAWELIGNRKKESAPPAAGVNPVEEARKFISDFSKKVAAEKGADKYGEIINTAGETWSKDPFLLLSDALKNQKDTEKPVKSKTIPKRGPDFVYTGFLAVGQTKLAIINGLEYKEGDSLNVDNYYVKSIAPRTVVIAQTKGAGILELPLQESFTK
jgi:hypothetical protein